MNEGSFYSAKKVAARIGCSLPDLEFVLGEIPLEQGMGWRVLDGELVLTKTGLEAALNHLRAAMSTPPSTDHFDFTADIVAPADAELAELTVHRIYPNPRLLEARTASGALVVVEVKTNRNFKPKMKMRALLVREGRYHFTGQCPRRPGRF